MKKIYFLLLMLLLPFNVYALEGNITVNCDKTIVSPGDVITCVVKGNVTNDGVSSIELNITSSNPEVLFLENVDIDSAWEGDGDSGDIKLYSEVDSTGSFGIVTFTMKAKDNIINGSDVKINLSEINFYNGNFEKIYSNSITKDIRIASTVNTLSSLELVGGELSPLFDENTFSYSSTIDAEKVTINANTKDSKATVSGVGEVNLKYGINNIVVKVTSEAGTSKTYSLIINRPDNRDTDNTLATLKINGTNIKLDKSKLEYTYEVENSVTEASVVATLNSKLAILSEGTLERNVKLAEGNNKIIFKVMAENEKVATYTITINRKNKAGLTNPKTGSGTVWVVLGTLVVSVVVGICSYEYYKKKVRKNDNEKK